jgi:hypothetical protein
MNSRPYSFRVTMLLAAALVPLVASADISSKKEHTAKWRPVRGADSSTIRFYVDDSSIRKQGDVHHVRLLYDFKKPQLDDEFGIYSNSYVVDTYVNCDTRKLAAERMTYYIDNKAKGRPIGSTTPEIDLKWSTASEGSINGAILDAACDQTTGHAAVMKDRPENLAN